MNPFEHEPRKPLTPLQRAKLFAERKGICGGRGNGGCGLKIKVGEPWIDEHALALGLGGTNDWENRELRHPHCAKEKTKEDTKQIAKNKRIYARHVGAWKSKRPMPCGRKSQWKKKMDGSVVRRDEA